MAKPNIKCDYCGKEFYKKPNRIVKDKRHTCNRKCLGELLHREKICEIESKFNKPIKEILEDLYLNKMYPARRIGKEIGLSYNKVCEWLKKYNVTIRYGSEAVKTQWLDNDDRRKSASEIAKVSMCTEEVRNKVRKAQQTEEYKKRQSESKKGSKNGMWRVCGEKHPNWDINRTHEKRAIERKSTNDNIWRSTIFCRDNRTCCKCNQDKGKRMVVHHINSYDIYESQRYDIDNGIVMCEECHKDFHYKYGYGKNTKEQFKEYLKLD